MDTLRRRFWGLAGIGVLATAVGCASSIQPLASQEVLADPDGIEGQWEAVDEVC